MYKCYCFLSAVIILFANLELSGVQTCFYISVIFFAKSLFSLTLLVSTPSKNRCDNGRRNMRMGKRNVHADEDAKDDKREKTENRKSVIAHKIYN